MPWGVISGGRAGELKSVVISARNRGVQLTVAIAQLVERQVVVLDVAGSSPVGHPCFPIAPGMPGAKLLDD